MVVFELSAASLLTCGPSTLHGAGAAAGIMSITPGPHPFSTDLLKVFNPGNIPVPGHHLLSLKSLTAAASTASKLLFSKQTLVTAATTGFGATLSHWWSFEDEEEKGQAPHTIQVASRKIFRITAVYDGFMLGAVLQSFGSHLTIPLRAWALGGLMFTFPTTWAVEHVSRTYGFRNAFKAECAAMLSAWSWMVWGSTMLAFHPEAAMQDPFLFYTSFISCYGAWTLLIASLCVMVATTMAAAVMK